MQTDRAQEDSPAGGDDLPIDVRTLAAFGSAIGFCLGLVALVVALLATSLWRTPDATVLDGDPCCPHPDSWGDVMLGVGTSIASGIVGLGLCGAALLAATAAITGRTPLFVAAHELALRRFALLWWCCVAAVVAMFVIAPIVVSR